MGALEQAAAAGQPVMPQAADAAAQAGAPPVGAEAGAGAPPPMPGAGAPPAGAAPPPAGAGTPPPAGVAPTAPGAPPPGADPRAEAAAEGPPTPIDKYLEQADPREQQEYERAMRALAKVLYGNDGSANSIVDQIKPANYVSDTAKVTMMLIKELDRAINMDESVIASITQEAVERISELAEARHQIEYKRTDLEQILGATWEGVQSMFGNEDTQGFTDRVGSIEPQDMEALKVQNESILASAK